ncbi:hypothetical protein [Undibacterium pigrum]|uniref:hypothetical protein n=1 Tax=Undibacterium pigrum TaxID=401470 RepID=UPI001474CAE2|nr:hypothetical protein [Undibacterium pigrum]
MKLPDCFCGLSDLPARVLVNTGLKPAFQAVFTREYWWATVADFDNFEHKIPCEFISHIARFYYL